MPRYRSRTALLSAPVALALLVGCTAEVAQVPETTPAKAPSFSCTPTPGAPPVPCTPEQYSDEQRRQLVAAEAQTVYRELFAELSALQRAGGTSEASAALSQRAGGPYLTGQLATLTTMSEAGAKLSGDVTLAKLVPAGGAAERGYEAAVLACVDATKSNLVRGSTTLTPGKLIAETVYFRYDGDLLKAWDSEKAATKKSC